MWAGLLWSCTEEQLTRVASRLVADPPALDLGEGCLGVETLELVSIRNDGRGRAELLETRVSGDPAFTLQLPQDALWAPGMSRDVGIAFRPLEAERVHTATVVLVDDDGGELWIPVRGRGGLRRVEAPSEVDFGVVDEGRPETRMVVVRNVGGSPLTVSALVWTSTSAELGLIPGGFEGGIVPPKSEVSVGVVYDPRDLGEDSGVLSVLSDDPNQARVDINVRARANLRPSVELWACRNRAPREEGCAPADRRRRLSVGLDDIVNLDGRAHEDPEGGPVRMAWSMSERPDGSNAAVFPGDADTGDVQIDRPGRYRVELRVRDARGLESEPAEVELTPRDLVVTLDWDQATDVDLHLVRPGGAVGDYGSGAPGRSEGSDCSTFNRAPNWGDLSVSDDDPRLERDAVTSAGAEVIGLDGLEAGAYTLYAHHCDSRDTRTRPGAVLRVDSRGQPAGTTDRVDLPSGALWRVGTVRWDSSGGTAVFEAANPPDVVSQPQLCRTD